MNKTDLKVFEILDMHREAQGMYAVKEQLVCMPDSQRARLLSNFKLLPSKFSKLRSRLNKMVESGWSPEIGRRFRG
jgi:hypothetical protein